MNESTTLLDALADALARAGEYNKDDQAPPAAILWPDKERQWEALVPELRPRLPLLTLGGYRPEARSGPAYYIRCMIGRTLEDRLSDEAVPIVYLPGVSRQDLRAIEECPRWLQPLADLQYRGVLWTHRNGRDWSIAAFLQSAEGGLGIAVAADTATREALLRSLPVLGREPLAHLRREAPLKAPFLDGLLNPDEVRRLLLWLNDPKAFQAGAGAAEWTAFGNLCRQKYGFDPAQDGELAAAARLGQPKGAWEGVWQRFLEAPDSYPNLPELLRRARPARPAVQLALFDGASPYWPQDNEAAEAELREALLGLKDVLPAQARTAILGLEAKHGVRRGWVWARLDQAPLAAALEHLVRLARLTETGMGGADLAALTEAYTGGGWQTDAAALDALAVVTSAEDAAAVRAAVVPLYRPWLEKAAVAFQALALPDPAQAGYDVSPLPDFAPGTCIVFSDALRYDAGRKLAGALTQRGRTCQCRPAFAALPPVTGTAKPAISPVASRLAGSEAGLTPSLKDTGAPAGAVAFRKLLAEAGYQVLASDQTGEPDGGRGWTEAGAIDQYGHGHGWKIAAHLEGELRGLEERIDELLAAGWQRVVVITDHGWLMLPGGLPKVELPLHLTLARKGRCAVLKPGARTDQPAVPWYWNRDVSIAVAPGIACYEAGKEYEHGGLSLQECVVPVIEVMATSATGIPAITIKQVSWRGLRCEVELGGLPAAAARDAGDLAVDIRGKAGVAATSLIETTRSPGADGKVSLLVPDDERMGEAAFVVVVGVGGAIYAQALTTVGG